ncbi:MAG: ATP-binding cassette domain-containing protein, partial [Planctomycetales bacterium]|nr:ATP-binding cassette domain-containing protein [Planctomycetales bacterium]
TSLPSQQTILDYLDGCRGPDTTTQTVLDVAGSFLFQGDLVQKRIAVLSGGERARLCLAGLLLAPHNVLVLDEPGNHLDVETVDALADALNQYPGTVILTSHDRHFVHRVANSVIEIKDGKATHYPGNYDTYLYRVQKEVDDDPGTAPAGGAAKSSSQNKPRRQGKTAKPRD